MVMQELELVAPHLFAPRPNVLPSLRNYKPVVPQGEFDPFTFVINELKEIKERVLDDEANEPNYGDKYGLNAMFLVTAVKFLNDSIKTFERLRDAPEIPEK